MQFSMKTIVLFGLVALSTATPIMTPVEARSDVESLEARMAKSKPLPDSVTCAGTSGSATFSKATIANAKKAGVDHKNAKTTSGSYPKDFGNKDGKTDIFPNKGSKWYEYPIFADGHAFTGAGADLYRVIFKENGDYVGLTQHKNARTVAC